MAFSEGTLVDLTKLNTPWPEVLLLEIESAEIPRPTQRNKCTRTPATER